MATTDLAWKLSAVLTAERSGTKNDLAADRLLDSYGQERQAHVRELTSRIKGVGAVICERDVVRARARDTKLLADCGGMVKDTPRQDILPALSAGLLHTSAGAGTLFPQPRMVGGLLMDQQFGGGWRLVCQGLKPDAAHAGVTLIDVAPSSATPEAEGVVAAWMQRHGVRAALVRPDHYVFGSADSAAELASLLAALPDAPFDALPAAILAAHPSAIS